jgi:hypothetical protein
MDALDLAHGGETIRIGHVTIDEHDVKQHPE